MKIPPPSNLRGAALLTTLILVSAVSLVVISYFAITRQEAEISGGSVLRARAALGEKAGFEEAKALLQGLTANDEYLVTAVLKEDSDPASSPTRYTYVTRPGQEDIVHTPLFLGGKTETVSMPDLDATATTVLTDQAIAAPQVEYDERVEASAISIESPSHLNPDGTLFSEQSQPRTHFAELPQDEDGPFETRYTYWMEDLEGYPNLDVVGTWTDYTSSTSDTRPSLRLGYASSDPRAGANPTAKAGLQLVFQDNPEVAYAFPREFRGQTLLDQVAPGLSPREIDLSTWPLAPTNPPLVHPYAGIGSFQSSRLWTPRGGINGWPDGDIPSLTSEQLARFSSGLRTYLREPLIPFGHNYIDQGKPRWNINALIANRDMEMANIVTRNLANFDQRKGGFPDAESYVGTLAANAIDYVDEDSAPTTPANTVNAVDPVSGLPMQFRGVDAYCPVNEFFVRFEYRGYRDKGGSWDLLFEARVFAEFWNTSNQEAVMPKTTLKFRLLETMVFKVDTKSYSIEDSDLTDDEPAAQVKSITVPANGYVVEDFGLMKWTVTVPKSGNEVVAFPIVQDLKRTPVGSANTSIRCNYELLLDGVLADQCGRRGTTPNNVDYGFFFPRYNAIMESGDAFMRMATAALVNKPYGFGSASGSHLGDPWMPYYSFSTSEDATYKNKASPGGRNVDEDKVKKGREDVLKDQARVRDWPDGGYDNTVIPSPSADTELPSSFTNTSDPNLAPWRLSQRKHFFSVTELGNLYDPVMWTLVPSSVLTKQTAQTYSLIRSTHLESLPADAIPANYWGGGNTLRIGRPEHIRFDQPGMRASQWLDLFHVGTTGTNLGPVDADPTEFYAAYDPRDHQSPPTSPDAIAAESPPYSLLYDPELNAQGRFREVKGLLNINSVPTAFELETILRGPLSSGSTVLEKEDFKSPTYTNEVALGTLVKRLDPAAVQLVAADLLRARPFYSPSHLARVFSESLKRHNALPKPCNDAEAEESFARLFNLTTLSSRHFRIYTHAETYHEQTKQVLARSRRVYEVFLEPVRDSAGAIEGSRLEVLRVRNL